MAQKIHRTWSVLVKFDAATHMTLKCIATLHLDLVMMCRVWVLLLNFGPGPIFRLLAALTRTQVEQGFYFFFISNIFSMFTVQNLKKRMKSSLSICRKPWLILAGPPQIAPPSWSWGRTFEGLAKISHGSPCSLRKALAGNSNRDKILNCE